MRVLEITGVSALAPVLIDSNLLGMGAIKYGSPDLVLFQSGGPASHLAQNSILCGPTNTRIVIKQVNDVRKKIGNNAMEGQVELLDERPVLTAEIEEWKHGCWYHSNIISAQGLGDLLNKLKQLTPNVEFLDTQSHLPRGAFWAGSIAYDIIQYTQPISLEKLPQQNEILAVLWLVENYILHSIDDDVYSVYGINEQWTECVEKVIDKQDISVTLSKQPVNTHQEISSVDDEQHHDAIEQIKNSIANGVFYQVNFGRFWSGKLVEHPLTIFQRLTISNPAPFSAYIEAVDLGLAIVSSSPETLLRCNDRILSTAPIKGTVTEAPTNQKI